MSGRVGFTIDESARRLGRYRWWSERMFELLGGWVPVVPEPDVKLRLATSARHHAWHAQLLGERLPEVGDLRVDAVTVAPSAEVATLLDELGGWTGPDLTIERTTVVARVLLPHVATLVREHRARCTAVADGAVERTLGFVAADLVDDWLAGEAMLQVWCADPAMARRAAAARAAFEPRWLAAGGMTPPA